MALKKYSRLFGLGILVLSLSGLWACSSGGGRTTSSGGAGTSGATGTSGTSGTLTINMTDSPFLDAKAVLVTFSEVQVHHTSNGWVRSPLMEEARAVPVISNNWSGGYKTFWESVLCHRAIIPRSGW